MSQNGEYFCNFPGCKQKFPSKRRVVEHFKLHQWTCDHCDQNFADKYKLKHHKKTHTIEWVEQVPNPNHHSWRYTDFKSTQISPTRKELKEVIPSEPSTSRQATIPPEQLIQNIQERNLIDLNFDENASESTIQNIIPHVITNDETYTSCVEKSMRMGYSENQIQIMLIKFGAFCIARNEHLNEYLLINNITVNQESKTPEQIISPTNDNNQFIEPHQSNSGLIRNYGLKFPPN